MALPVVLPLMPDALGGDAPSVRVEAEHPVPYGTFREDRCVSGRARHGVAA